MKWSVRCRPVFVHWPAAINAEEHTKFGADEQQIRIDVILHQAPGQVFVGQVRGDAVPAVASVGGLQNIGFEVTFSYDRPTST